MPLPPRYRIRTRNTETKEIQIFSDARTHAEADQKFSEAIKEDNSKEVQLEDSGKERGEFKATTWYDPKRQSYPCREKK